MLENPAPFSLNFSSPMKYSSKERSSPKDCGGVSHPQRHSYYGFRHCGTKGLSQNFYPLTLGKNERGRGPRYPPIFLVT